LPADWRLWLPLSIAVFGISAWLLFFRLGHYPLWDDEACTALFARGIARTGDTCALQDHNIYVFRGGSNLKNLRGRYEPPGPFYLAAPFVGVRGTGSFWPRVPFAACGLCSVGFLLFWMARSRLTAATWLVMSIGLLGNVSFFLFCRQCRYYAMAMLLTLVIAYLYLNWKGRWSALLGMIAASCLLLWTHYLPYAGLYAVLACDYLLFARRQRKLTIAQWTLLLGSQLIVGLITVWIYNPVGAGVVPEVPGQNLLLDKLTLIWWNFQDFNNCEFCAGIFLLAALVVYLRTRNVWLLRAVVALVVYILAVAILSPQPVAITSVADIRYLSALIPLGIVLSALVVVSLARHQWLLALLLAIPFLGTNVLNDLISPNAWTCRTAEFAQELCSPRANSIDFAVRWIDENVRPGESVWVLPDYMESSLMYHAPHPVYAWHLNSPPQEQFAHLPAIHFKGRIPPDYMIFFSRLGPAIGADNATWLNKLEEQGTHYQLVKILDVVWNDLNRPEVFWRYFQPVRRFDRKLEAIYVYRRKMPEQGPFKDAK
jgi:hypothetical protein